MKILFIGPYRQDDGWGNASRKYLKALSMTENDVHARPIFLNSQSHYRSFKDQYIVDAEQKSSEQYDIVIQNCLPNMFRRYGDCKNIGISFFETDIENTPWKDSLKVVDSMWVSSENEFDILTDDILSEYQVYTIPIPTDIDLESLNDNEPIFPRHDNEYVFYFIGENIERKNIDLLIKAFHLEFKPFEQVKLILKVNNVGKSEEESFKIISDKIHSIKNELGLYKDHKLYKKEFIITRYLSEVELAKLHRDADCFVMPSSGEGFCIPAFEAMAHDSWVIANYRTSITDYINHEHNGSLVDSHEEPAVASDRPLHFLYNGRDIWYKMDLDSLMVCMRNAYNEKRKPIKDYNKLYLEKHSYRNISDKMTLAMLDKSL